MRQYGPEFPKPYTKIPFVTNAKRSSPPGHHKVFKGLLTGVLELRMTCLRPVQVASGAQDFLKLQHTEEIASLQTMLSRYEDKPGGTTSRLAVVPGASLKGAIRSAAEAISYSCVRVTTRDSRRTLQPGMSGCHDAGALCPACRVFGMSGQGRSNHQGQVAFEDAYTSTSSLVGVRTPLLWRPYLTGQAGRRLYHHGRLASGDDLRLAIRTGTELAVKAHLASLSPAEAGLLVAAVGCHPKHRFPIKIGGGKPVGMGSVRFELTSWQPCASISARGRMGTSSVVSGDEAQSLAEAWTDAAERDGLLAMDQLNSVAALWAEERLDDESPSGTY
jgi:hypothetical protein